MKKSINELNEVLNNTKVGFDLEFVARLMKVLELANDEMGEDTEQKTLVENYANTLYHEITNHMTPDEFSELEDEGMIELW